MAAKKKRRVRKSARLLEAERLYRKIEKGLATLEGQRERDLFVEHSRQVIEPLLQRLCDCEIMSAEDFAITIGPCPVR